MSASLIESWYHDHGRWLASWLQRKSGCHALAADLLQDTFVRLLGKAQMVEAQTPRALLTRIAHGLLIDHWRHQDIERAYFDTVANLPEAHIPPPEVALEIIQTVAELDQILSALPSKGREVFLLSQVESLPQDQIAKQLNISLATTKRHLRQALIACMAVL